MNELTPQLAALLTNARQAHEPSEADRERVFGALQATLGAATVVAALSHASSVTAGISGTSSTLPGTLGGATSLAAKWWIIGALALGGAGLWTAWPENTRQAKTPVVSRPAVVNVAQPAIEPVPSAPPAPRALRASKLEPSRESPVFDSKLAGEVPQPAPPKARSRVARTSAAKTTRTSVSQRIETASTGAPDPRTQGPSATPEPTTTSDQPSQANRTELALVRATLTALRDGRADEALSLLDEHAQKFPQGAMAHERNGLHAVALCDAGQRTQGLREKAAFLRSDSSSALAQRVRRACP